MLDCVCGARAEFGTKGLAETVQGPVPRVQGWGGVGPNPGIQG